MPILWLQSPQRSPAFGRRCRACNRGNHFSSVCRSAQNSRASNQRDDTRPNNQRGRVKRIIEDNASISSDDEHFVQAVTESFQAKQIRSTQKHKQTVTVRLHDVDIRMEPDSGARVNLMDEHKFQALLHRTNHKPTLEPCHMKLNTLQHPLKVKRKFETIIRNQTCGKHSAFVVVQGRINSPPLLSKDTLIQLRMLKIQPDGGLSLATSWGNYRPKRLIFSIILPRCLNQLDDLFIGARNWTKHNATLEAVLQRAENYIWNNIKQNQMRVWKARIRILWLSIQSDRTDTYNRQSKGRSGMYTANSLTQSLR